MSLDRSQLIARLHEHMKRHGWPRVEFYLIVSIAGFAGFGLSYALLQLGVTSMAVRYAFAGVAGYLAFLGLLAMWLAWKRSPHYYRQLNDAIDVVFDSIPDDEGDARLASGGGPSLIQPYGGRPSSGGSTVALEKSSTATGSRSWTDGDADIFWILVAIAALGTALLAVGYVLWSAPALLAEVLVDAAIVSAVSRQGRRVHQPAWTATAIRRTWIPALIMIVSLAVGGYALQKAVPDARSIGPALQAIVNR